MATQKSLFEGWVPSPPGNRYKSFSAPGGAHVPTSPETRHALFSPCRTWRYRLELRWREGPLINFLMLNPSIADEERNDPTVTRCIKRARALAEAAGRATPLGDYLRRKGLPGGIVVTNLYALVSTDPKELRHWLDPVGPDNDRVIRETAQAAAIVICAWGTQGDVRERRSSEVVSVLRCAGEQPYVLRLTKKTGVPEHPLYIPLTVEPTPWNP